jgi:hypothetical protein
LHRAGGVAAKSFADEKTAVAANDLVDGVSGEAFKARVDIDERVAWKARIRDSDTFCRGCQRPVLEE